MNFRMVFSVLGKSFIVEAVLLIFPALVSIIYGESNLISFVAPMALLVLIGAPLSFIKTKDKQIYSKEGFIIVALVWICFSLFGALPYVIGKEAGLAHYIDALFETVSGFTTTGSSVVSDTEALTRSAMFWRLFTHFIGGMGVLVFLLALLPEGSVGLMHIYKAESPGPNSSKMIGKMKYTARVLYSIYVMLTVIQTVLLLFGGMSFYESLLNAFATAGTGGLSIHNSGIAYYNSAYIEMVIAVFMFLFSVNFNIYYLILIGGFAKAIKSEEFITYIIMVFVATITIALNILGSTGSFVNSLRLSFFQVTSISSTTGFTTANYDAWPAFSKGILLLLTIVGACGGSTGGGMKVSRLIVIIKSGIADVKRLFYPRSVISVRFEGKTLLKEVESNVKTYFNLYISIVLVSTLILSLDGFANGDLFTHISASFTCISNVGPGFNMVGPTHTFAGYSDISKLTLSAVMLLGRLEFFPILALFLPKTWKKA